MLKRIVAILFFLSFITACPTLTDEEEVLTEVEKGRLHKLYLKSATDFTLSESVIKYENIDSSNIQINITRADIDSIMIPNGKLFFGGDTRVTVKKASAKTCNNSSYYLVIMYKDGHRLQYPEIINIETLPSTLAADSATFKFYLGFTDSTYNTAENHTYKLEFWECTGRCQIKDYYYRTDKKDEVVINVNYVP